MKVLVWDFASRNENLALCIFSPRLGISFFEIPSRGEKMVLILRLTIFYMPETCPQCSGNKTMLNGFDNRGQVNYLCMVCLVSWWKDYVPEAVAPSQ